MTEDRSRTSGKPLESEIPVWDQTMLKVELKDFLRRRPGNLSAAAKEFGLSRQKVEEILSESKEEFEDVENEYLDNLEECVFLSALGTPPSREFSFNEAIKILERKRPNRWAGKAKPDEKKKGASLNIDLDAMLKQVITQGG